MNITSIISFRGAPPVKDLTLRDTPILTPKRLLGLRANAVTGPAPDGHLQAIPPLTGAIRDLGVNCRFAHYHRDPCHQGRIVTIALPAIPHAFR